MKAVQVLDLDKELEDFAPGEWQWLAERVGIIFRLPNGHLGSITNYGNHKWSVTGDGETISATPSIWYRAGQGPAAGEWHGYLTNGEWLPC